MVHKLAPAYLNELIPPALNIRITRQDQANKLRPIHCRHEFYRSSFLPSATNLWNNELNNNQRIIPGKQTFKHAIYKCFSHAKAQQINTIGKRSVQILTAQLRMNSATCAITYL